MEINIQISENGIPYQEFNGKYYYLYPSYKYFKGVTSVDTMHRDVWIYHRGKIPPGFQIHHINENKWDNRIENLQLESVESHAYIHAKNRAKLNPEFIKSFQEKGIAVAPEWHRSPEGKEWHSAHGKDTWDKIKSKPKTKKNCIHCGREYETYMPKRSKYCGHNCNVYASKINVRNNKK